MLSVSHRFCLYAVARDVVLDSFLTCLFYGVVEVILTVAVAFQLNFFSSLKEMRIINEKLLNEISSPADDTDVSYVCWFSKLMVSCNSWTTTLFFVIG